VSGLRILQLIPQTKLGGAESFAYALSCELARRGHQVLILSNRANGPLFSKPRPPGVEVAELDRSRRTDPRILSFLFGHMRRFNPDVIHSHNFEANTWARAVAMLFPRVRVFCHEHSGDKGEQRRKRYWIDRILFLRCAGVFAVSENVRLVLERRHKIPPGHLSLIRNGIDVRSFLAPPGTPRDPLRVLSVANLTPVKNHTLLLKAWRRVLEAEPHARLTLVGGGALRPSLEEQARAEGIAESIRFAGVHPDVRPFLWESSVFVLSSLWEAMPLAICEAMAAGLACVAPSVGGIPEIITDGATGRLYPPGDEAALAETLLGCLHSPGEAARIGERAREYASHSYDLSLCAEEVERWYTRAALCRSPRARGG
jgi:glycosyltransferase involved in cell wall biosynthesis